MAKGKAKSIGDKNKYNPEDKVYAMDNGDLYEAKVIKYKLAGEEYTYFLHYMGWNSRWDKWVTEKDLMAAGPDAEETQKRLKEQKKRDKAAGTKRKEKDKDKDKEQGVTIKEDPKSKKPRIDVSKDMEDDSGVAEVKITMPFTLKKQLVTDWESVTQEPWRLVKLPREITASQVMERYMESKVKRGSTQQAARYQELIDGLRIYFDKALPLILLYRQERRQYERIIQKYPAESPCNLYGAEHLLRLFVRLPQLLAQTALTATEVTQVQAKLGDFLRYMQKNHAEFFLHEYEDVDPEDPAGEGA